MKNISKFKYEELKNNFLSVPHGLRAGVSLIFDENCGEEDIERAVEWCGESSIGLIVPEFAGEFEFINPTRLIKCYSVLLHACRKREIKAAINLTRSIEGAVVRYFDDTEDSIRSRVLVKREYFCTNREEVKLSLPKSMLAVVAVEERGDLVDLRPYIDENGELVWNTPDGNWRICRYMCAPDEEQDRVNMMNYDVCRKYLTAVISLFKNTLSEYFGNTLSVLAFSDICFTARNRRNWDEGYNDAFMCKFGYDPAPYYPCLFECFEDKLKKYKPMLMDIRARMLREGIMQALHDTAEENGMEIFGTFTEPKLSAPSWVLGDTVLSQEIAPCARLEKSYLYGMNSVKVALGASLISGNDIVYCNAFQGYKTRRKETIYRESSVAFSRGVNMLAAHLPQVKKNSVPSLVRGYDDRRYFEYINRIQSVLCGGETISDIAVLYPIHSLHSGVSLYDMPVREGVFEYPETPDTVDYMSVINSIESYAGRSTALVHPDILRRELETGKYKVLVLPAVSVISVDAMRAASHFFDRGGKIIATGVLPRRSAEIPEEGGDAFDIEVRELVCHIFGANAHDEIVIGDYKYNKTENGGEAYFIYSTSMGVDRCNLVPGRRLARALDAFGIAYDVYIEKLPRADCTGVLNLNYPDYATLGLSTKIKGRGLINYIHKKRGDTNIYFFSTLDIDSIGDIYLKGDIRPQIWDAENGEITDIEYENVERYGEIYTKISVSVHSGDSLLIVGK